MEGGAAGHIPLRSICPSYQLVTGATREGAAMLVECHGSCVLLGGYGRTNVIGVLRACPGLPIARNDVVPTTAMC